MIQPVGDDTCSAIPSLENSNKVSNLVRFRWTLCYVHCYMVHMKHLDHLRPLQLDVLSIPLTAVNSEAALEGTL
jgi:hypothetical protein